MNIIKTVPAALVPLGRLSVQPVKKNKTHILKIKNMLAQLRIRAPPRQMSRKTASGTVHYRWDFSFYPHFHVFFFLISRHSLAYVCVLNARI